MQGSTLLIRGDPSLRMVPINISPPVRSNCSFQTAAISGATASNVYQFSFAPFSCVLALQPIAVMCWPHCPTLLTSAEAVGIIFAVIGNRVCLHKIIVPPGSMSSQHAVVVQGCLATKWCIVGYSTGCARLVCLMPSGGAQQLASPSYQGSQPPGF